MKRIYLVLLACCLGFISSAQTIYQPNGTFDFTGANTYCVGAPISPITFTYTTCNSGTGVPTGASCQVWWYYNLTNSTSVPGATLASGPIPFVTNTSGTGSVSYTPALSVGGNYYFFCVIEWTGGAGACGGVTGTMVSSGTQLVTISPAPISPAAPINICQGDNITLTNAFTGGTWVSSNPGVVSINAATGVASGLTAGGSFITYTLGSCFVTAFMYVNSNPAPITHPTPPGAPYNVCVGAATTLANATPGGTWTSTMPAFATLGSSTGIVSGFGAGVTTISYIVSATGCFATRSFTVNPNPAPIAGSSNVCVGGSTMLTNSSGGGVWQSSSPGRASVNFSSGLVNGNSAGTARISYTLIATGCHTLLTMNVNPSPAPIAGPGVLCATNSITLTNTVAGGSWSTSDPTIATVGASSGVVAGISAGSTLISYTTAGCTPVSRLIIVNALPGTIAGVFSTCNGDSTSLTSTAPTPGGTWRSSDTTVATAGLSTGKVYGISMGTTTITYTVPSGCRTTVTVTVNPLAPILGSDSVCVGAPIVLTNIVGGGTWVSSNPANASIDTFSGVVNGLVNGITYIGYHLPTGCFSRFLLHVIPALPPIGGPLSICSNSEVTLSNGVSGGTWSTSNEYVADIVDTSGIASGHFADTATITYTVFGCVTTTVVTVNALPETDLSFNWLTKVLTADAGFAAYQWYDSLVAIPGATGNTYTLPNKKERYRVVVTDFNGCSASSDWFKFPLGLNEVGTADNIRIYPNPAVSSIHIDAPKNTKAVIAGIEGKTIIETNNIQDIDISNLAGGIFFVSLYNESGQLLKVEKLVKQ
jgi:uncharacterized protein YjdB